MSRHDTKSDYWSDLEELSARVQAMERAMARSWTTGDVRYTLRSTAADGWLFPIGQAVTIVYPALRSMLLDQGAPWGMSGDDPLLPDLGGRVLMGAGAGAGMTARTLGDLVGDETHVLTVAEMPSHRHSLVKGTVTSLDDTATSIGAGGTTRNEANNNVNLTGGGGAHPNVQPSAAVSIEIRT